MAVPVSPVVPGLSLPETVYAKNQPPYQPLPVWKSPSGTVLSRWHLSWRERLRIMWAGDVYLWVKTFNAPLQPLLLEIMPPAFEEEPPLPTEA